MQLYPSPASGSFTIRFHINKVSPVTLSIANSNGALLHRALINNVQLGENTVHQQIDNLPRTGVYFITLETSYETAVQKIVVTP